MVRRSLGHSLTGAAPLQAPRVSPRTAVLPLRRRSGGRGKAVGHMIPTPPPASAIPSHESIETSARALRQGSRSALILGGGAVRGRGLELAGQIATKTGCKLICEHLNARVARGAGRVRLTRIPYAVDQAIEILEDFQHL